MVLLSRIIGLGRQTVINAQFGLGPETDAWFAAFRIPDTLFTLFAGGALISAFIPVYLHVRGRGTRAERIALFSAVLNLLGMIMTVFAIAGIVFAPVLMDLLVPGFDEPTRAMASEATRYLMLSPLLLGISAVFKGALHAERNFFLPAVGPVLYNLGIIAGAVFLAEPLGIVALAWGTVAGAVLHVLVQIPGLRGVGLSWRPVIGLAGPARRVAALMLPRLGGFVVIQLSFVFINFLASLQGPSGVASFANAWMLMSFPLGLVAVPFAEAALPVLAQQHARGDRAAMTQSGSEALTFVFFATLPIAFITINLAGPIVGLLFERGAFDAAATAATGAVLAALAVGLLGHCLAEVLTRIFYAMEDTRRPVLIISATLLLHMAISWALAAPFGVAGIALGISIGVLVEVVVLVVFLRRVGITIRLQAGVARMLFAAALSAGGAWLAVQLLDTRLAAGLLHGLGVVTVLIVALLLYVGLAVLLGLQQPRMMADVIKARLAPGRRRL